MRVLFLTKYGRLGASSRLRTLQYLPYLQQAGVQISINHLMSSDRLQARYKKGGYSLGAVVRAYLERCKVLLGRSQFDLVWIEKEAFPWWPLWLERLLLAGKPYVLDYDDAIFHNYDKHRLRWVRCVFGRRLDGLMANATLVVAGNPYLAQRAEKAGAKNVQIIPTVIDLERYPVKHYQQAVRESTVFTVKIVWIGSPSTVKYLKEIETALQKLAVQFDFVFMVIGGEGFQPSGVKVQQCAWSEETEVELLLQADIGVMPLIDSAFERGKCGYKLVQYMACGLPVVASPIGVNVNIVHHQHNGYLAATEEEWVVALGTLLANAELRQRMGVHGRYLVEQQYCIQRSAPELHKLLLLAVGAQ